MSLESYLGFALQVLAGAGTLIGAWITMRDRVAAAERNAAAALKGTEKTRADIHTFRNDSHQVSIRVALLEQERSAMTKRLDSIETTQAEMRDTLVETHVLVRQLVAHMKGEDS